MRPIPQRQTTRGPRAGYRPASSRSGALFIRRTRNSEIDTRYATCGASLKKITSVIERVQLVPGVDHVNAGVSGRESLNGAAEPGRDLLEIDVFDGTKSVRAKNRSNASRLETADRTFVHILKLFGPLLF